MPKNDRDLILWNLLKFLCVKAKLKIVRFGDSNLVTWFSGLTFAVASVHSSGAPNENIVQNHLNIALLNAFQYLNGRYSHSFTP